MPSSLYVHIPFCLKRCLYCDFVSGIYSPEKEIAYVSALTREINDISADVPLKTLYIGGGTPTSLSIRALSDVITSIFRHFSFTGNYEATIEANPGTLSKEKLKVIKSSGIDRVSIGVQSFQEKELHCLGRMHSSLDAERAVALARDTGIDNVSIDLIYGIPGQTEESLINSLEKAVHLKPQHISAYELSIEKETPLSNDISRGRLKLPDEERIILMYEHTINYLESEGFLHYEISNFAIKGFPCRHNINYWDRGEYYGVGLGAHSFMKGMRYVNSGDLDEYIKNQSVMKRSVQEAERIDDNRELSEALFLGLRKTQGIPLESFAETY
ncbi:MAG: radical SAM family heme chaperone HemW, partial [Nitrospiraceae bacterium]